MAKANSKFRMKDDDEAVVGIGTLIVFVATILVAAIASGVIIKTAYSLKDQAERTGLAARQEVTGGPKIIDIVGDRSTTAPLTDIQRVQFTITTWEGSDAINMKYMTVHWIGPTVNTYLTLNTAVPGYDTPTAAYYGAEEIPAGTAGNGWAPANGAAGRWWLDDDNNLWVRINIATNAFADPAYRGIADPLAPGAHVTVVFIPSHGPPVTEEFVTPNDYGSAEWIDLTNA